MKPFKHSKRSVRLLAFGPALVLACATAYAASGVSVVSSATGASTVGVTGSVGSSFSANPIVTGCAESVGTDFASPADLVTAFGDGISDGCAVEWSSNNGTGSEVVFENDQAGAVDFFCGDPDGPVVTLSRDCATDANTVDNLAATPGNSLAGEGFGIALVSTAGDTATSHTGVSAADATPTLNESIWAGIPAQTSPSQLCRYNAPNSTSSTCTFSFGAHGKGALQGMGDYSGTLRLTARLT